MIDKPNLSRMTPPANKPENNLSAEAIELMTAMLYAGAPERIKPVAKVPYNHCLLKKAAKRALKAASPFGGR